MGHFLRAGAIVIVLVAALAAGLYWWRQGNPPRLPPNSSPAPSAPSETAKTPRYVLESPPDSPRSLPRLNESDPTLVEALSVVFGADTFAKLFLPEDLVRRIVATIDNLPREAYSMRLSPLRPAGGLLRTTGQGEDMAIGPGNAARYASHVRAAQALDGARLVGLYVRFYPLFQQAYVDLGYPNGYFNDRLVEVIDHLLATPEVTGPIRLTTPHVLHEFADPELEARSSGQKLLLRMGGDNAAKVKAKLREIRREVVAASKG